jgi:hypothetical protein
MRCFAAQSDVAKRVYNLTERDPVVVLYRSNAPMSRVPLQSMVTSNSPPLETGARRLVRSGTLFNELSVPTDIVFLVVLWRPRDRLNLRTLDTPYLTLLKFLT